VLVLALARDGQALCQELAWMRECHLFRLRLASTLLLKVLRYGLPRPWSGLHFLKLADRSSARIVLGRVLNATADNASCSI
jgi:hypothetical protein